MENVFVFLRAIDVGLSKGNRDNVWNFSLSIFLRAIRIMYEVLGFIIG